MITISQPLIPFSFIQHIYFRDYYAPETIPVSRHTIMNKKNS